MPKSKIQDVVEDIRTNHHDYMIREMQQMRQSLKGLSESYKHIDARTSDLSKRFEHFARDLIQHMDEEETMLFPWVLAETGRDLGLTTIDIDTSTLEHLAAEDRSMSYEFAKIIELTRTLSFSPLRFSSSFKTIYTQLCEMQQNLKVHLQKEHDFILPFIERHLRRDLSHKVSTASIA